MTHLYLSLRRKVDVLLVWIKGYCISVMLLMLAVSFVQVIKRYAFNDPWSWSDEIVLLLLGWFAYPSIVFNTWKDDHFYIGSVYEKMSPGLQKAMDVFRYLLQGVFLVILAYFGVKLMNQYWNKPMAASGWSQGLRYIPVIFGAGMSTLFCIINLIGVFVKDEKKTRRIIHVGE